MGTKQTNGGAVGKEQTLGVGGAGRWSRHWGHGGRGDRADRRGPTRALCSTAAHSSLRPVAWPWWGSPPLLHNPGDNALESARTLTWARDPARCSLHLRRSGPWAWACIRAPHAPPRAKSHPRPGFLTWTLRATPPLASQTRGDLHPWETGTPHYTPEVACTHRTGNAGHAQEAQST